MRRGRLALLAMAGALALKAQGASAQLDRFIMHGEAAKRLLEKNALNVETAREIADGCFAFATARRETVSVAIYDPYGTPVLIQRMDGQGKFDVESAMLKAQTVLTTRAPSHIVFNNVLKGDTTEFHQQHFHNIYADKGGLPIRVDDQFLGAIGVSGAALDEECAQAGLESVLGPQPPLTPTVAAPRAPGG